jgi:hypothetical protein
MGGVVDCLRRGSPCAFRLFSFSSVVEPDSLSSSGLAAYGMSGLELGQNVEAKSERQHHESKLTIIASRMMK